MSTNTITQSYAGKNVFITGGTGFIGKVLTEKLLRTFKDIGTIYWLARQKKSVKFEDRLLKTWEDPLFDLLKKKNPDAYKKIKLVSGDIGKINLGLSYSDYEEIINRVSIVFHVAATIKFHEDLTDAILLNVRGTRDICNLVLSLKHISAFVHVSTAYCHHQYKIIEEKTYPVNASWKQAITTAENIDRDTLNVLTYKYIGNNPNTYTFTKALAEKVVEDLCRNKIPLIIFRPAIVTSVYEDPLSGWTDNLNGPFALWLGIIKGAIRSYMYVKNGKQDIIPVDYIVKGLISSVWKHQGNCTEVKVYNGVYKSPSCEEFIQLRSHFHNLRIPNICYPLLHPCGYYWWLSCFYCLQLLPAVFLNSIAKFSNRKPMILRLQRKIFRTFLILYYFATNTWEIKNENFLDIIENIPPEDFKELGVKDNGEARINNVKYVLESMHYMYADILKFKLLDKPIGKRKILIHKMYSILTLVGIAGLIGYFFYYMFLS